MNNITFGQNEWGYYETVAGGAGAVNLETNTFYSEYLLRLYSLGSHMGWP